MYLESGFIKGVGTLTFGVIYWQQLVNCFCQLFREFFKLKLSNLCWFQLLKCDGNLSVLVLDCWLD